MGRLALCAGWLVLFSFPAFAARTPEPKPSSLDELLKAAGVDRMPRIPSPQAGKLSHAGDKADADGRIHYECRGLPYGEGESGILLLAQGQACRSCGSSGDACRYVCREVVLGQPLPRIVASGDCH